MKDSQSNEQIQLLSAFYEPHLNPILLILNTSIIPNYHSPMHT